jgi:hypothetical protein
MARVDMITGGRHLASPHTGWRSSGFLDPHEDMALDVVHVGDGVVHHQAQGQDQGEHGHPVDGVAENEVHEQRQGKDRWHGQATTRASRQPRVKARSATTVSTAKKATASVR